MSMTKFADVNNIRCFAFERDESKIFRPMQSRLRLINQRRIFFSSIAIFHLFKPSIPMKHRETGRSKRTGNIRAIKTIKIVTVSQRSQSRSIDESNLSYRQKMERNEETRSRLTTLVQHPRMTPHPPPRLSDNVR